MPYPPPRHDDRLLTAHHGHISPTSASSSPFLLPASETSDHIRHTRRMPTARDVADRLAVSTETVMRWTRSGDLPAIKLPGGALRFDPDQFDAWLQARKTSEDPR